jgi:hypothetical protein
MDGGCTAQREGRVMAAISGMTDAEVPEAHRDLMFAVA